MLTVTNQTRGTTIGEYIKAADTSFSRIRGLLGRRKLSAGSGIWIRPSSGVHTIGMSISIDVVGLDKDLRVTKLWPNLVPFRITSVSLKLRSVLELPVGTISDCDIRIGDQIGIAPSAMGSATFAEPAEAQLR